MMEIDSSTQRGSGEDVNRDKPPIGRRPRLGSPFWLLGALALGALGGRFLPLVPSASADPAPGPIGGKACDNRILKGNYGFTFTGSFSGGIPFVGVGSESCDETGYCTGVTTLSIDGAVSTSPFTAQYTINPDCTGVETANYYTIGLVVQEAVSIVDGGREVNFMGTDPGGVSVGVMKRR
jgi:hypothetical protein